MNNNQDSSTTQYFDADRPIECREQDLLSRRFFADAIAEQARAVPAKHGFTIAVVGEWGSGKTSVLNMVSETLEADGAACAVVRFNPWLFGSADDLVTRFFRELSAQLGQSRSEGLKDVAKALSSLGQFLAPLSPVPGTAVAVKLLDKLTNRWNKPPTLHDKRGHLRKALAASESRVVVLIDDIDRLEASETRKLMRLVRLTSDLPNVVFLLAFDRRHVARSLGDDEAEGGQYLDKIVQLNYNIPTFRETVLSGVLLPWLNELIEGRDVLQIDQEVWGRIYYEVIRRLLGNLRDVKRFLYSLPVTLDTLGQEVALADLLGLEALRVLRPSMFNTLKAHADCLVHSESGSRLLMPEDVRNSEINEELSAMLDGAEEERDVLNSVLEIIFPATQGFLGRSSYGPGWIGTWRKQRRVACEEVLRIYLQGGLEEGALQSHEIRDLMEALTDERELSRLLDTLDPQRFEGALDRLADFEKDFPVEAIPTAVPVLLNRISRLSRHTTSFLGLPPRSKARYIISRLLRRNEDPSALMDNMLEILDQVDALSQIPHLDKRRTSLAPATKGAKMFLDQEKRSPTRCSYYEARLTGIPVRTGAGLDRYDGTVRPDDVRGVDASSGFEVIGRAPHETAGEGSGLDGQPDDHLADAAELGRRRVGVRPLISLRRTEGCAGCFESSRPVVCVSASAGRWRRDGESSVVGACRRSLRCSGIWRGSMTRAGRRSGKLTEHSYLLPMEL